MFHSFLRNNETLPEGFSIFVVRLSPNARQEDAETRHTIFGLDLQVLQCISR
jgi:hypothetical protein